MTLSFAELTDPANAAKYSTYDGLIELTKRVSVTVPGQAANALTIQYSNTLTAGGIKTEALALAFSDALGGQVRVINRTPLAEFLTSDQFIAKERSKRGRVRLNFQQQRSGLSVANQLSGL